MEKTIRLDDIDGGAHDVKTVVIALDSTTWAIDLSADNRARLDAALAPFLAHARRVKNTRNRRATTDAARRNKDIRAWAAAHGIDVSPHGKIPASIAAQYDVARARTMPPKN